MATSMVVAFHQWAQLLGVWIRVLPDPLTSGKSVRVTVHRNGAALWVRAEGPCGGVALQTVAPEQAEDADPCCNCRNGPNSHHGGAPHVPPVDEYDTRQFRFDREGQ